MSQLYKISDLKKLDSSQAFELGNKIGKTSATAKLFSFAKRSKIDGPRFAVSGPHRAGKDTVCQWFALNTKLKFNGTSSFAAIPLIAQVCDASNFDIYANRHSFKMFLYHFLNGVRDTKIELLPTLTLEGSNFLCGTRSKLELISGLSKCDHAIWVNNIDVGSDPTLEYDCQFLKETCESTFIVANDIGSSSLCRQLLDICDILKIPVLPNPHAKFERHGISFVE